MWRFSEQNSPPFFLERAKVPRTLGQRKIETFFIGFEGQNAKSEREFFFSLAPRKRLKKEVLRAHKNISSFMLKFPFTVNHFGVDIFLVFCLTILYI